MLELGEFSKARHREIGEYLAHMGIDVLLAVGADASEFAAGARSRASANSAGHVECYEFSDRAGVVDCVMKMLKPGDVVLVKGSRGARMDVIADEMELAFDTEPSPA
jgi:UDP-N-acetylmuramoyl-tripeptide--D-alanyl-D-alanine ligase